MTWLSNQGESAVILSPLRLVALLPEPPDPPEPPFLLHAAIESIIDAAKAKETALIGILFICLSPLNPHIGFKLD